MVLNMAQTWHQVRPGEVRTDCGGCHAHSQKPTPFEKTAAAKPDYPIFDLTQKTPLLTTKALDQSGKKWDAKDETGLRFDKGIKNVEYFRDVKPILDRSCAACHTEKHGKAPAGLVLDDDASVRFGNETPVPGTYYPAGRGQRGPVRFQAGDPQRPVAADQRLALHPQVPVAAEPFDLESLRSPLRRLDQ